MKQANGKRTNKEIAPNTGKTLDMDEATENGKRHHRLKPDLTTGSPERNGTQKQPYRQNRAHQGEHCEPDNHPTPREKTVGEQE